MLQTLSAITECDSVVTAKADALDRICINVGTAAASLAGRTLEEIDMACERGGACATVKRLNTYLMALCKQVFAHAIVQSDIHDAQDASFRFQAGWRSARGNAKATERHLAQVGQQRTVAQTKLAHGKSHLKGV